MGPSEGVVSQAHSSRTTGEAMHFLIQVAHSFFITRSRLSIISISCADSRVSEIQSQTHLGLNPQVSSNLIHEALRRYAHPFP